MVHVQKAVELDIGLIVKHMAALRINVRLYTHYVQN
jgi:hypothetical protein